MTGSELGSGLELGLGVRVGLGVELGVMGRVKTLLGPSLLSRLVQWLCVEDVLSAVKCAFDQGRVGARARARGRGWGRVRVTVLMR